MLEYVCTGERACVWVCFRSNVRESVRARVLSCFVPACVLGESLHVCVCVGESVRVCVCACMCACDNTCVRVCVRASVRAYVRTF